MWTAARCRIQTSGPPSELEPPVPTTAENYPSAQLFEDVIESTFMDEKLLDMVEGPLSEQEAADSQGELGCVSCAGCVAASAPSRDYQISGSGRYRTRYTC